MGTHPIFESDFDCLTVFRNRIMLRRSIQTGKKFSVTAAKASAAAQPAVPEKVKKGTKPSRFTDGTQMREEIQSWKLTRLIWTHAAQWSSMLLSKSRMILTQL